jgi:hypothetical protein
MNLVLTPDTYAPSIDKDGNYIDGKPLCRMGILCPCSVSGKVYDSISKFTTHTKSKRHKKWIEDLNWNKANHYIDLLKMKELVENQRQIITKMDNQMQNKVLTIDYLTKQIIHLQRPTPPMADLLDINI